MWFAGLFTRISVLIRVVRIVQHNILPSYQNQDYNQYPTPSLA
jgi:hypothetical protein